MTLAIPARFSRFFPGRAPPGGGSFLRISGVLLLLFAYAHFAIMHLVNSVDVVDYDFVAGRWASLGWRLFDWLLAEARREGCEQLHLDSGVQRYEAHGFYLKNRLHITSHHFTRVL